MFVGDSYLNLAFVLRETTLLGIFFNRVLGVTVIVIVVRLSYYLETFPFRNSGTLCQSDVSFICEFQLNWKHSSKQASREADRQKQEGKSRINVRENFVLIKAHRSLYFLHFYYYFHLTFIFYTFSFIYIYLRFHFQFINNLILQYMILIDR